MVGDTNGGRGGSSPPSPCHPRSFFIFFSFHTHKHKKKPQIGNARKGPCVGSHRQLPSGPPCARKPDGHLHSSWEAAILYWYQLHSLLVRQDRTNDKTLQLQSAFSAVSKRNSTLTIIIFKQFPNPHFGLVLVKKNSTQLSRKICRLWKDAQSLFQNSQIY